MTQFILLNRLKVQDANAVSGITWGFPSITHFLGFTHNLERKLLNSNKYNDLKFAGCAVVAHEHQIHVYGKYNEFTQKRNPPYLPDHDQMTPPPIIEEGKMNMTVSLVIACVGNIGNRKDRLVEWLEEEIFRQGVAGGTIINKKIDINIYSEEKSNFLKIKQKLLPGFILVDRSFYLREHYEFLKNSKQNVDLFETFLDFVALKKKARPISNLIESHFFELSRSNDSELIKLAEAWFTHIEETYSHNNIPEILIKYFESKNNIQENQKLLQQWSSYISPSEDTNSVYEYITKPNPGYLIPIMVGYKAISTLKEPGEIQNMRDSNTSVCFVESVHTIGEWKSVHRLKTVTEIKNYLWNYTYEENWYLCKQLTELEIETSNPTTEIDFEYDFY